MDARAVALAAGIDVATLNVWVQRGQIPGMSIGARGRRRDFDVETATRVAIIAQLVRFGMGAPQAAFIAGSLKTPFHRRLVIASGDALQHMAEPRLRYPSPVTFFEMSSDDVAEMLQKMLQELPILYAVVDVERLEERMKKAQEYWDHGVR
jgi:hypothetical protein